MSNEADQIAARVQTLLAELPADPVTQADLERLADGLEDAHALLLRALESAERG